jgi:phosphoribosylformimino-5-aminoimidazole carboxamide ribotide isomerase
VARWLDGGVGRVILGTAALKDPAMVRDACARYPGRIGVGIDARDGRVAVEGWAEVTEVTAFEAADRFEDAGLAAIVYTDIARDGALEGPNVGATVRLAAAISTPVIASGGVASMDDLRALKAAGSGVLLGAIAGRAVYDGRIDAAEAAALLAGDGLC